MPHVKADYHLPLLPGSNVAVIDPACACRRHPRALIDEAFVRERCDLAAFEAGGAFHRR